MKCLDLYCCGGGAAKGYHDAGFEVVGVDIIDRPNYPYTFIKGDALDILNDENFIKDFDFIHASPPCQRFTRLKNLSNNIEDWNERHPDLVNITRERLIYYNNKYGIPYVIENVEGAPLINPIKLCGSQFPNMFTQRPRLFESSLNLEKSKVPTRNLGTKKLGAISETGAVSICGQRTLKGLTVEQTRLYYCIAIGGDCDWMSLEELTQCIPPCYTKFIGTQVINYLNKDKEINTTKMFNFDIEEFIEKVKKYL